MGNRQAVYSVYSVPRTIGPERTVPSGPLTLLLALDRVIDEVGDFNCGGNNSDHAGRDRDAADTAVYLFQFVCFQFGLYFLSSCRIGVIRYFLSGRFTPDTC